MEPQVFGLFSGKLEHEVRREPVDVSPDLLIEALSADPIELGQVCVQQHLFATNQQDSRLDAFRRNRQI